MKDIIATFVQNPEIDILFGMFGATIPSKKEDFKPVNLIATDADGKETIENFYIKKPSSKSVRDFEELIRKQIINGELDKRKFLKPSLVEVAIAIHINKSRFFDIDVDNIAKTVLDSLTGYLFEDDSQVVNLICKKDIHPLNTNGFFIAVTEVTDIRKGLVGDFWLYSRKKD